MPNERMPQEFLDKLIQNAYPPTGIWRDFHKHQKAYDLLLTYVKKGLLTIDRLSPIPNPLDYITPINQISVESSANLISTSQANASIIRDGDSGDLIYPGSGWEAATTEPSNAIGSGAFSTAKTIARWDCVPYQTVTGNFNVGVVAFHADGINRVEFAVDGGQWIAITTPTLNTQVAGNGWPGVVSYFVTIRASDFTDGLHEIRAIAYPNEGYPRLLESMWVNTNANSTLPEMIKYVALDGSDTTGDGSEGSPYATTTKAITEIRAANAANGATIYFKAGTHSPATLSFPINTYANTTRWITFAGAPGLAATDVVLMNTATNLAGACKLVRIHNCTVRANPVRSTTSGSKCWHDKIIVNGLDRYTASTGWEGYSSFPGGQYITDSDLIETGNGPKGFALVRNVNVSGILDDAFSFALCVINATVTDIDPGSTGAHPDIYQTLSSIDNVVISGVTTPDWTTQASSQGFMTSTGINPPPLSICSNFIIVDCNWSAGGGIARVIALGGDMRHLILRNSTFRGAAGWNPDPGNYVAQHLLIDNATWLNYSTGLPWSGPAFPNAVFR